jgi:hypothetical protein
MLKNLGWTTITTESRCEDTVSHRDHTEPYVIDRGEQEPMDLGTIMSRLENGQYRTAHEIRSVLPRSLNK